jgi:Trk-type K+ transport system membrane component
MKIMRVVLLMKDSYYELRRMVHPNAIIPVRFNKRAVPDYIITNVLAFFMFYFIVFVFSTIIFTVFEPDLDSAMGAVATCLGNIGPGLGNFGPVNHFGHLHEISKWFLAFLMLLGRLELFTVLVLFSPGFWKNKDLTKSFCPETPEICPLYWSLTGIYFSKHNAASLDGINLFKVHYKRAVNAHEFIFRKFCLDCFH